MDRRRQCQDPYQIMRESLREEAPPSSSRGYGSQDSSNPRRQRRSQGQATSHQRNCYAQGGAVTMVMNTAGKMVPQSSQPYAHGGKVQRRQEQADMDSHSPFSRQHASERTRQREAYAGGSSVGSAGSDLDKRINDFNDDDLGHFDHQVDYQNQQMQQQPNIPSHLRDIFQGLDKQKLKHIQDKKNQKQQMQQQEQHHIQQEEKHAKTKRHLDEFEYEKYPLQVGPSCAANAAYRYRDHLQKIKSIPDLQTNPNEDLSKDGWNIRKTRLDTLTGEQPQEIANFVNEANRHKTYQDKPPLNGGVSLLASSKYLRDLNYLTKDFDTNATSPKERTAQRIKYINNALDQNLPVMIHTPKMQYPPKKDDTAQKPLIGNHDFLITGTRINDPEWRKQKKEVREQVLQSIGNKILTQDQERLRDEYIKKYDKIKDTPYKVYWSDSNRPNKQKGYVDKNGNVNSFIYGTKGWVNQDSFPLNNNIIHGLSDISHVTGYIDKNQKKKKF